MEQKTETTSDTPLTLTESAVTWLKEEMAKRDASDVGLRVMVFPGGCSGLQYGMSFAQEPEENEQEFEHEGIRMFLDTRTLPLIDGATVDYVDSLMGGGLNVQNPNAQGTCGCGKSFC